jgi:hypothetical protein
MIWVVQQRAEPWKDQTCSERLFLLTQLVFQFWFNAVGGFVGWIAVWFLWGSRFGDHGWKHLVAFVIAFVGITGNLPHLSTGIRAALGALAKRVGGE